MADLLKPQYKGRIASTPYAAGFDWLAVPEAWGEQRVLDYLAVFKDQVTGLIRCNEMERIATGEFDVLAMQCSQSSPLQAKLKRPRQHVHTDIDGSFPLPNSSPMDESAVSAGGQTCRARGELPSPSAARPLR